MELTFDQWVDTYKPIETKHGDLRMFETYGEDLEIVKAVDNNQLWTWTDGGDYSVITNGFSFVNRLNYYISTVPWKGDAGDIVIDMYEPDECEKDGHQYETVERYDGKEYECCKHCGEDQSYLEQFDD
jgi:hypothetical protein